MQINSLPLPSVRLQTLQAVSNPAESQSLPPLTIEKLDEPVSETIRSETSINELAWQYICPLKSTLRAPSFCMLEAIYHADSWKTDQTRNAQSS